MLRSPPLLIVLALGGCATSATPPSLAPRAVESLPETSPPRLAPVATAADAELIARLSALVARAAAADAEATLPPAEVARLRSGLAAKAESEPWIAAQARRAAIESARASTSDVLAELDELVRSREAMLATGSDAPGFLEARAARDHVAAMVERQSAAFAGR